MREEEIVEIIRRTESPLKKQLLTVALISKLLAEKGKNTPVVIGGCALAYYSREVYFTSDIDLAYSDREALDQILVQIGFEKRGRYWINENLDVVIEVPASSLPEEEAPLEIVEFEGGLFCKIIGIEDLIIDRLNACKHWKSEMDCEMVELLLRRYFKEIEWSYLEKKAEKPENDTLQELLELKGKIKK
jgi:hypothetical protein